MWPEFELALDFMPIQIICMSHKDLIKTKQAMLQTRSNMGFFKNSQEQVTPKSIVQSGLMSKLSEIYGCPGYLQVWRRFDYRWRCYPPYIFSIIRLWEKFSSLKSKKLQSEWADLARTHLRFYGCPRYLQVWQRHDQKWSCYWSDNIFPLVSLWKLSTAIETRDLIQSAPKPYAAFPPPQWCFI